MSDDRLHKLGKRADRWRVVLVAAIVFVQTAAILFLAVTLAEGNSRAVENRHILDGVDRSSRILVDCTTPHHACYDRGQTGQQKAIDQLNHIIVLAAFCSKQPGNGSVQKIEACVVRGLK